MGCWQVSTMKDTKKTKDDLVLEIEKLKKQVKKLEVSEIKHQQAEEELAKRTEQLVALYELGKKITSLTSKDELLPWIAEQAARLLETDVCKFWIKEGPYLIKGGGTKDGLELMQKERLRMGESLSGIIAKGKKPLIVDDVRKDERYIKSHRDAAKKLGYVSFFGVPMLTGEKTIGVLNIYTRKPRKFTQKDVELLSAFADMAAVALENARLIGDLQQEITERRNAEKKIQASLEEKNVLLKEIHNRVRNNLEVTSSLLALQASLIKDTETAQIYRDCQDRIKAMVLGHERLYQSKNLAKIDLKEYVETIKEALFYSYGIDKDRISLRIDIKDIFLDISTAIPCALIINEVISNALQHAFPNGRKGEIFISLRSCNDNKMELILKNNGICLPEDFDLRNASSIGLQVINILVKQLKGEIRISREEGAEFHIVFHEKKE
jgi:two-component sensor histidine kinase/putative methionine-R-sulfoxide reductase with GAF domain